MSSAQSGYRVLVADKLSAAGVARLREGVEVDEAPGLSEAELVERVPGYDAMVVRSATQVTAPVLEAGRRLKVVARAGVGVDNIDVAAATRCGIIVVNSPEGNTIAAAEHTVAMLLALARRIPDAVHSLRQGEWKRTAFVGIEVYGKTAGVIGFGKIGREVARRLRGFGMRVLASDAYVTEELARREGVELVDLDTLLAGSDFITVHAPLTRETRGMIGDDAFARARPGVRIINCARGGIVDEEALLRALEKGQAAGAALDVFSQEPPPADFPLIRHPAVIATPHLGASTEEAQVNVAVDVAGQILDILAGRPAAAAVNMPAISAEVQARVAPYMELGEQIGRLLGQIAPGPVSSINIEYWGDILELDLGPITRSVLLGLLRPALGDGVNLVNAPLLAEERGVRVVESKSAGEHDYSSYIRARVECGSQSCTIGGAVLGKREVRIREIDQFRIDVAPYGSMLYVRHTDKPGIIGKVGTLLGEAGINIGDMHVGREEVGRRAVMLLTVDTAVPEPLRNQIAHLIEAEEVISLEV